MMRWAALVCAVAFMGGALQGCGDDDEGGVSGVTHPDTFSKSLGDVEVRITFTGQD